MLSHILDFSSFTLCFLKITASRVLNSVPMNVGVSALFGFQAFASSLPLTILSDHLCSSATSLQTAGSIVLYSIDRILHVLA